VINKLFETVVTSEGGIGSQKARNR